MDKTIADLIGERFGVATDAGRGMPAEGMLAQILARRVHRRYKPQAVPEEMLQMALAAALSAPSKSDFGLPRSLPSFDRKTL